MPKILFEFMHILVHFRCSILNFHNLGTNQYFLIPKKVNKANNVHNLSFFRSVGQTYIAAFFMILRPKTYPKV